MAKVPKLMRHNEPSLDRIIYSVQVLSNIREAIMIYNTTYRNDHDIYLINQTVGRPFSFIQRLKMGGIGTKRMTISGFSPYLREQCQTRSAYVQFGFLEMRPWGILVLINKQLQNFTWPIPYPNLMLETDQGLRVLAEGQYVHFANGYQENQVFIQRLHTKMNGG
ncbi:MAG: hypothetical protein AAGD05_03095 [Bacteroidota bacterium]